MLGEIERLNERDATNHQTRIWIDIGRAAVDHVGTDISTLFRFWQERTLIDNGIPKLADFERRARRLPYIAVDTADPLNYTIHNHPAGICGNWNSYRLGEHAVPMHARSCALEYYKCKSLEMPVYVQIQQKILGVEREYAKVLLPVAEANGKVSRVYYAWRFMREPVVLSEMN